MELLNQSNSRLFLSYSRNDEDLVKTLSKLIEARGWNTWVDRKSIPSASEWMAEIRQGIESAYVFVFVLTPHSLASRMCRVELSIAVDLSKRLLPLLPLTKDSWAVALEDIRQHAEPDFDDEVPPELQKLDYIELNDFTDRDQPLEALADELIKAASQDLDWLRLHTRLQQDVKRWVDGRYSNSALLRGALLTAAEEMLQAEEKDPPLTALQREFVQKSREELQRNLEREANQLGRRILDLEETRIATGVMLALEGLQKYTHTPLLLGAIRTLISRWPQYCLIPHEGIVTSVSFNNEGTWVLSSALDGFSKWVEIATGRVVGKTGQKGVPVWKALFDETQERVFTACGDGYVRIFELKTQQTTAIDVSREPITNLELDEDAGVMVVVAEKTAVIIDLTTMDQHEWGHPEKIRDVIIHKGKVVTSAHDGKIRFFDHKTQATEEFTYQEYHLNSVCISPEADWMAVSGSFGGVLMVDLKGKSVIRTLEMEQSALLMALSDDGRYLAATDIWGHVFTFETGEGKQLQKQQAFTRAVQNVIMIKDGSLFAATADFGVTVIRNTAADGQWLCAGHDGQVGRLAFDPAGKFLATGGVDHTVRLFGVGWLPSTVMLPHPHAILHTDFSPNGMLVVTTSRDDLARVFSLPDGRLESQYHLQGDTLLSAEFVNDREIVVAGEAGQVVFVDAFSGREKRSLMVHPLEIHTIVKVTDDQQWVVVCEFDEVKEIFSVTNSASKPNEQQWREIEVEMEWRLGLAHGEGRIVEREGGRPPVLEVNGKTIHLQTGNFQVMKASFSPDGAVIVGAALNQSDLPIFDSTTGELIATLNMKHEANDARFNAQGDWVAASWLNAVTVIHYPKVPTLLKTARSQVHRQLSQRERSEFSIEEQTEGPE